MPTGVSSPQPDPFGTPVNQFGTPVNQFGTPVNQFGTPVGQLGAPADQLGSSAHPSWGGVPTPAPRGRSTTVTVLSLVVALALLAGIGAYLRVQVFPDLSKPIELPATAAGLSGSARGGTVSVQAKDAEGRATAVSVYLDPVTPPTSFVLVAAGRRADLGRELTLPADVLTTRFGKVTCTADASPSSLLGAVSGSTQWNDSRLAALQSASICWRQSKHLTVVTSAFSATASAQSLALQAMNDAWDAI
jgi:hypothetical protein